MTTTPSPTITLPELTGSSVGPFATGWKYDQPEDVRVYLEIDGVAQADLIAGTDFTLTGANPPVTGGSVLLSPTVIPGGVWDTDRHRLILRRRTPRRQSTALPDVEGHKPRATEKALDRAMRIAEEISDEAALALKVAAGDSPGQLPADRASRFLAFDAEKRPIAAVGVPDVPITGPAALLLDDADFPAMRATLGADQATNVSVAALMVDGTPVAGFRARSVEDKARDVLSTRDFEGFDWTGATSSHVAFQNAINAAILLKKKLLIQGDFKLTQGVTVAGKCEIVNDASVITCVGNFDTVTVATSDARLDWWWTDELSKTGGKTFALPTGAGLARERIRISNFTGFGSRGGVEDSGTGLHIKLELINVYFRQLRGTGFKLSRVFGYGLLFDCTADFNGSGALGNHTGFDIAGTGLGEGSGGVRFWSCHVLGEPLSGNANQNGFVLTNVLAPWFTGDNTADSCAGKGYQFIGCNKVQGYITGGLCQDDQVTFDGTTYSTLLIDIQGRNGIPGATAGKHNIVFKGLCNSIAYTIGYSADPTGSHVYVAESLGGPVVGVGGVLSGGGAAAIKTLGSSSYQHTGGSLVANASNYDLSSALHHIEAVFASGARATFSGPGTA